jgi:hypothetical protein
MSARAVIASVGLIVAGVVTWPGAAWAESGGASPHPNAQTLVAAAQRAFTAARARFEAGSETLEAVYTWSRRWLEAQRRLQPAAARAAAREHRSRMTELCAQATQRVDAGLLDASAREACAYYLAEAELLVSETP